MGFQHPPAGMADMMDVEISICLGGVRMARDKQVNVLLTAETVEGLRAEAARGGVSLSEVVRGRIEGYPSAVADAEDWRRAAMARCADAERCAELEGECARLRAEIERLRGAQASRAASRGIGGDVDRRGPSAASDGPRGAFSGGGVGDEMMAAMSAHNAEVMAELRRHLGR